MTDIYIDSQQVLSRIKPMHAVNNGPIKNGPGSDDNFEAFREVGFPFVRNHDASFCASYGGEHTVDILAIFPDFDKDPYDPASYDFEITDVYLKTIRKAGSQVFYRLGNKIEHTVKKYGSNPPKDFRKWAVICEHIIRHYTEGWANGFRWEMPYWEIWNEPDNVPICWTGTMEQFRDLFRITAKHLKKNFPHLKIGGPAFAEWTVDSGVRDFLKDMRENEVPLDFLSWHTYSRQIGDYPRRIRIVRKALDEFGYTETESILNEWNYLVSWTELSKTSKGIRSMDGAALAAAVMLTGQQMPVDMLMYYDAQPTAWNGLFDFYTFDKLKAYYSLQMFSKLYRLENQVSCLYEDADLYAVSAAKDKNMAAMICYYTLDENATEKQIKIHLEQDSTMQLYLLDREHDCEPVMEFTGNTVEFAMKPNSVLQLVAKIL